MVSITPSGGWIPAVIAGRTGVGLSQRAQSFVTREEDGPFNVIAPGKYPRVTLTPTLALKESGRSSLLPCKVATRRTRTCCSSSSTSWNSE